MQNKFLLQKVFAAVALLCLVIMFFLNSKKVKTPKLSVNPVEVTEVTSRDMSFIIQLGGVVEPYETITIKSQVNGQLLKKNFTDGQSVKAGALLFQIDDRDFKQQLEQAKANLARDQSLYLNADKEEQRYGELLKKNFASKEQYAQMLTNKDSLKQTIESDKAAIELTNLQLERCNIYAPIDGKIGEANIQEGDLIQLQNSNLVIINKISPIYISFYSPENYLNDLKIAKQNNTLKIQFKDDQDHVVDDNKIDFIDNNVNPNTGTIKIKASTDNKDELFWPGQFVRVFLDLYDRKNALVIPVKSVQNNQNGPYVFVVKSDNTVTIRTIKIDFSSDEYSVIANGLELGEKIVTVGQLRLFEGASVSFKN